MRKIGAADHNGAPRNPELEREEAILRNSTVTSNPSIAESLDIAPTISKIVAFSSFGLTTRRRSRSGDPRLEA
jgi:hypothetical protein